jgi:hypothetical protein
MGLSLTGKKIHSLAKKYFSIPVEFLSYYPSTTGIIHPLEEEEEADSTQARAAGVSEATSSRKKVTRSSTKDAVGARQPGRPKKPMPALANQPSILSCFAAKRRDQSKHDFVRMHRFLAGLLEIPVLCQVKLLA